MRHIDCITCHSPIEVARTPRLLGKHRMMRCKCGERLLSRAVHEQQPQMSDGQLRALGLKVRR